MAGISQIYADGFARDLIPRSTAPTFLSSTSYAVGDYVYYQGSLYRCTTAHTGTWVASHFTAVTIGSELKAKEAEIADVKTDLPNNIDKEVAKYNDRNERNSNLGKYWEIFPYTYVTNQSVTTGEYVYDYVKNGVSSYKVTKNDANTLDVRFGITSQLNAYSCTGLSLLKIVCYIPDASKFSNITVEIVSTGWSRTVGSSAIANGWNTITFVINDGSLSSWTDFRIVRVAATGTAGREIIISSINFLRRPKGIIIFVNDSGYASFLENGYPDLKALNVPTTWALDPLLLGTSSRIAETDVDTLALDGTSEFSFHGYSGDSTSSMSGAELLDDTVSAIRWLSKKGLLPRYFWRAAFVQNNAPNYQSVLNECPVLATWESRSGPTVFPFINQANIPRVALHNLTQSGIDAVFERLTKTHCLYVIYTHGIGTGTYDTTAENWEYFINKLTTAITNETVECATYNRLMTSGDY